jgi:hypothetical protein
MATIVVDSYVGREVFRQREPLSHGEYIGGGGSRLHDTLAATCRSVVV